MKFVQREQQLVLVKNYKFMLLKNVRQLDLN
jgi:hypothetical protein